MIPAGITQNEELRLKALRSFAPLDYVPIQALDDIIDLVTQICEVPMALISLIDEEKQWIKAKIGWESEEIPRDISFCGHAIQQQDLTIVPDAAQDRRFFDNPLVTGEPGIRFYAGAPLILSGQGLGTLCVLDRVPRNLTALQLNSLRILSHQVATHLKSNRQRLELMKSEAALQRLAAIEEYSHDAIITKDLNGIITSWNKGAKKIFGYTAEEMVGTSIRRLLPADRPSEEDEILERVRSGGKVEHFETVRQTKDGNLIDVSVTASPIFDSTGVPIGISKVASDSRMRKETAQQLALLKTCVSKLNDVVIVTESDLIDEPGPKIVFVNEAFERTTGYSSSEAIGKSPRFLQGAGTDKGILKEIRQALLDKKSIRRQFANYRKDGTEIFIDIDIIPIFEPSGNGSHFVAIQRDITEKRQAEERIAEQAAFLDKARDAIMVRDLNGKILFWNQGAQRIYGWTPSEALGKDIRELLYDDPEKFDEFNRITINKGEWNGELLHITKKNEEIVNETRWTLICDSEGQPKSVLAINTDITDKKKIEAQFMRAQRMDSMGTLASGVAHDLNNILAPIVMSIAVLKEHTADSSLESLLETIEISAKRGAEIVRQVLSFARGMENQRVELQFSHLLRDLETILKETFPKDIRMRFSISPNTWTILGDPTQMHQILLNLCVNARDAMPNGGNLSISIENCVFDRQHTAMNIQGQAGRSVAMNLQAQEGRYLCLTVSDSGTGIPSEIMDKIFEPFFTTKAPDRGTGLGLSTVLAIVKSHDGIINAYSESGKGTTFKIYLPALDDVEIADFKAEDTLSLPRGNGETVLVVDDEASIRVITSQTLQTFGYRVLTATDGADALSVYVQNKNNIAVVLTDMMMPYLNGVAMYNALKRINPDVRVIGTSGHNQNSEGTMPSIEDIKYFLPKPYTAAALLRLLKTILADQSDAGSTN